MNRIEFKYKSGNANNGYFSNDSPALPSPQITTEAPVMDRDKKENAPTVTSYDLNMNRVNNDKNWKGSSGKATDYEREEKNWGPVNEYHKEVKQKSRHNIKTGTKYFVNRYRLLTIKLIKIAAITIADTYFD